MCCDGYCPKAAVIATILFAVIAESVRPMDGRINERELDVNSIGDGPDQHTICMVSSNAPGAKPEDLRFLAEACVSANKATNVMALAFQDYSAGKFPEYINNVLGLQNDRFKLRHQMQLSNDTGSGRICYGAGSTLGMHIGAQIGARLMFGVASPAIVALTTGLAAYKASKELGLNCGGVAIAIYSLKKVDVTFDVKGQDAYYALVTDSTTTTKKGSLAMSIGVNNRQIIVASTHGAEGVRAKGKATECPRDATMEEYAKEEKRVIDFEEALMMINKIRNSSNITDKNGVGVLWGGDFNPRTVETDGDQIGCPIFPEVPSGPEGDNAAAKALEHLMKGRDVLGSKPGPGNTHPLVTFTSLLKGQHITEAEGLICPTYKKEKELLDKKQFRCKEGKEDGEWMFYKTSHPPSWTDRIFHTNEWLNCDKMHRVRKNSDHDAVLVTCEVQAP